MYYFVHYATLQDLNKGVQGLVRRGGSIHNLFGEELCALARINSRLLVCILIDFTFQMNLFITFLLCVSTIVVGSPIAPPTLITAILPGKLPLEQTLSNGKDGEKKRKGERGREREGEEE